MSMKPVEHFVGRERGGVHLGDAVVLDQEIARPPPGSRAVEERGPLDQQSLSHG
jgi:hypothetical protein